MPSRDDLDLEAYLSRVAVLDNTGGGRGYERGVRTFNCALCGDTRARGWMNITTWSAGCFNSGCAASPRLWGGASEWVRRREGLATRTEAWTFLIRHYRRGMTTHAPKIATAWVGTDWCRLPPMRPLPGPSKIAQAASQFITRQWGVPEPAQATWGFGLCTAGRYAWRIIIPIQYRGEIVSFQARAIRGQEPKYLTAEHGGRTDPRADCGRPIGALLYGLDTVQPGDTIVLVEGPGDVCGWETRRPPHWPAVGLLGSALTPPRVALLAAKSPRAVVIALDPDLSRMVSARGLVTLAQWGLPVARGLWVGAKDAGAGARLRIQRISSPWQEVLACHEPIH